MSETYVNVNRSYLYCLFSLAYSINLNV